MGADASDVNAYPNELPAHAVTLDAYWIDKTEAMNANFRRCIEAGGCKARSQRAGMTGVASRTRRNYLYDTHYDQFPILTYVVEDAEDYCAWAGRRLPTEAEWEKAARGTGNAPYAWGTEPGCEFSTFPGCTTDTRRVDSIPEGASVYGALNLTGNVWEWVRDYYMKDYYRVSRGENPNGPASGTAKVRRGGGWRSVTQDLRVTTRASGVPNHYFDGQMGFRCAMDDVGR